MCYIILSYTLKLQYYSDTYLILTHLHQLIVLIPVDALTWSGIIEDTLLQFP